MSMTDAIDRLKNACDAEAILRHAVDIEWSKGQHDGPMKRAHDAQIKECQDAARDLIALSDTG